MFANVEAETIRPTGRLLGGNARWSNGAGQKVFPKADFCLAAANHPVETL
jgi:hypothetical protein